MRVLRALRVRGIRRLIHVVRQVVHRTKSKTIKEVLREPTEESLQRRIRAIHHVKLCLRDKHVGHKSRSIKPLEQVRLFFVVGAVGVSVSMVQFCSPCTEIYSCVSISRRNCILCQRRCALGISEYLHLTSRQSASVVCVVIKLQLASDRNRLGCCEVVRTGFPVINLGSGELAHSTSLDCSLNARKSLTAVINESLN